MFNENWDLDRNGFNTRQMAITKMSNTLQTTVAMGEWRGEKMEKGK